MLNHITIHKHSVHHLNEARHYGLTNFLARQMSHVLQAPVADLSLRPPDKPKQTRGRSFANQPLITQAASNSIDISSIALLMPPSPQEAHHAPEGAAVDVLANPVLWRSITGFMDGWPFRVVQFAKSAKQAKLSKSSSDNAFPMRKGWMPHVAIAERNVKVLQVLLELHSVPHYAKSYEVLDFSAVQRCAVACKRLDMLQWLCADSTSNTSSSQQWENELMVHALRLNEPDFELMDWLYANAPSTSIALSSQQVDSAAARGNLALVRWLHAHEYVFTQHAMDDAASNGHLDIVQFLHDHRTEGCTTHAMDAAAANGHADVVAFLHSNRLEGCTVNALDGAAKNGHLMVVEFLHKQRTEGCTTNAMDDGARHSHLEIVQFLHEKRMEGCTTKAFDGAADNGKLPLLQFLVEHRTEGFSTKPISWSPRNLHLQIVEFLHKHRRTGWTTAAMDRAASDGHLEVVRFLHEHRSEGCTAYAMDTAAGRGYLDVVKFLHETCGIAKCTTYAMDSAAREGHLEVVRYLHEHRREGCTKAAMTQAILKGHDDVVQFLGANRSEGFSTATVMQAARSGPPALRETLARFLG